jgi:hypothetical protein
MQDMQQHRNINVKNVSGSHQRGVFVNKGSDMAVFALGNERTNYEIMRYQLGRYISSNGTVW